MCVCVWGGGGGLLCVVQNINKTNNMRVYKCTDISLNYIPSKPGTVLVDKDSMSACINYD